jgi:hypothetical protein
MADPDLPDQIARLEVRIEHRAEMAERCRKFILASRVAIAVGALLLVATTLGLIRFDRTAVVGSIAAVLGGIVTLGSNTSTLRQTTDAIAADEALRSELIGQIDLTIVADRAAKPH